MALAGPLLETARSADRLTTVLVEALLLLLSGSSRLDETEAVFEIDVDVVDGSTVPTIRTVLELPAAIVFSDNGVDQEEPALGSQAELVSMQYFAVCSWLERVSLNETEVASAGPAFETVIVYVSAFPAVTGSGEAALLIERSAELRRSRNLSLALKVGSAPRTILI